MQQLIPAMEFGTALLTPLAVLLAILKGFDGGNFLRSFKKAVYKGFWFSLFIIAVKQGTRNAVSREIVEGIMAFLSILSEIGLIGILFFVRNLTDKSRKVMNWAVMINVIALFIYYGMEIWLIPVTTILNVETALSFDMLLRMLGFVAGLLIAIISSWLIYHAAHSLNDRRLFVVFAIQVLALFFQQTVYLIQILMGRGFLPIRGLIQLMAPLIDHQSWFIFVVFLVVFMVPFALFLQRCPQRPMGANPAKYRKIIAEDMHKKRWGKASVIALLLMLFLSSFGSSWANKKEELIPAVPIEAQNGLVAIPIEKVNDGHLHRFAYRSKNGAMVRFIVVLKGGSAYGVGLDACEICGATGYIEREGQVICKLCDVVMNKSTIGLPGGCNPIPVEYGVNNGQVQIRQSALDEADKYFR